MPRPCINILANMDDASTKRQLMQSVGALRGQYTIVIKPSDPRRGNQQNRYWHGVVLSMFHEFIVSHGNDYTLEQAKDILVAKVLGTVPVVNPVTGEVIGETRPSTATLTKEQFSDLIEKSIEWLAELGIEVPPPELYYEPIRS